MPHQRPSRVVTLTIALTSNDDTLSSGLPAMPWMMNMSSSYLFWANIRLTLTHAFSLNPGRLETTNNDGSIPEI